MSVQGPATPAPDDSPATGVSTALTQVPPPPPGPGVTPPFVAPPTDGTKQRRWWAIGLAGGAVLVACLGTLIGAGSLVVFGTRSALDQSKAAVTNYLSDLRDGDFDGAYDGLCQSARNQVTRSEFETIQSRRPRIFSFVVAEPEVNTDIVVPATLRLLTGTTMTVKYLVGQDAGSTDYKVCGEVD